jgi:uncharacterized protein YaaN involved in tellurite resistance
MPEPRGLALGKTPAAAPPTTTAFAPAAASPPLDMKVAAPVSGQQLAPFTVMEIGEFGKGPAMAAAGIADKITAIARAGDMDEVGKGLNSLLITAKKYDPSQFKKGGGVFGFFKVKVQELKNQFATVDSQVDQLMHETDSRIGLFKGRIGDLETLYNDNEARYHELGAKAEEAERRIAWMEDNRPAVDQADPFSAQRLNDWNATIDYAKKRVDDMRRGQALCQMQAPQIKMMQSNSAALVMKFGAIKTDTIPALKNAFALYILNLEMEKGADFAKAQDDLTNQTLAENARKLGVTTVKVQTALSRSSIDLATLQTISAESIKAIDDVQRIRAEMQTRLQSEAPQITALTQQLTQRLTQGQP